MSRISKCRGSLSELPFHFLLKLHFVLLLLLCFASAALSQQVAGSYAITTPEASLFALDPASLNPATARGPIGLIGNPAALASVQGTQFGIALGFAHSDRGQFNLQLLEAVPEFEAVNLRSEFKMEEKGGLAAFGIGRQVGKFVFGFNFMQPRRAAVQMSASGKTNMRFHFDVDEPITAETVPDLPVESIPMLWRIEAQADLELHSKPAEISLSTLPLFFGAAYHLGPLALGAGLKYLRISSNDAVATMTTSLRGTGAIVGTPYGEDPYFGLPWSGTVRAEAQFEDQPFEAQYQLGLKGSRWACTFGSNLNLKVLKLGLTIERGFRDTLEGSYRIRVLHTAGPPIDPNLHDVTLDVSQLPNVEGSASLSLRDFKKDSLVFERTGEVNIGGYSGIAGGLQLLIFGLYAGGEIPSNPPDFGSFYFASYIDLPLFFVPVNLRAGFLQRMDFFYTEEEDIVPYRSIFHLTAGTAIRFGVQRFIPALRQPVELQVGVRSSLLPLAFNQVKDESEGVEDNMLPNLVETLTLGLGLQIVL
jgi:hypothetical protein